MEEKSVQGTLFVKRPSQNNELPDSLSSSEPTRRLVLTKFGLFEVDENDNIKSQVDTWETQRINLSEYKEHNKINLSVYSSDHDNLYYENKNKESYTITKGSYVMVDFSNLESEQDIDSPIDRTVLKVDDYYRGVPDKTELNDKLNQFSEMLESRSVRDKIYVLIPEQQSSPSLLLNSTEVEKLIDTDDLKALERIQ